MTVRESMIQNWQRQKSSRMSITWQPCPASFRYVDGKALLTRSFAVKSYLEYFSSTIIGHIPQCADDEIYPVVLVASAIDCVSDVCLLFGFVELSLVNITCSKCFEMQFGLPVKL